MQLIIAGFHRSGTSLLAQLLASAGLFVGDNLLEASFSNQYGHFEDREVLELHRSIIGRHGLDWQTDRPFPFHISPEHWQAMQAFVLKRDLHHARWGFKEPRTCLLMGAWKYLMPDAKAVIVYRDPGECVRSMESRQAAEHFVSLVSRPNKPREVRFFEEPDHGLRMWDTYNRALVAYARAHEDDCLVLPFSDLTAAAPVVETLNRRLGLDLEPVPTHTVFDPAATTTRAVPQRVVSSEVADRVAATWDALEELATRTGVTCAP